MKNYGALIEAAIRAKSDGSERSIQSGLGILGPSDIGFCRQKAVLMTKGVPQTDSTKIMAAAIGTAIHNYVEEALKAMFPTWLLGSIDNITVTATLPSGGTISGHPDIIIPEDNVLLDLKTKDGLAAARKDGASQQNKYQRFLYVLGCIDAGLLDDSKPIYVGNAFIDRSGNDQSVVIDMEEIDWTLTNEIDSWVTDVVYAVKNNEDASRDIPSPVCEKICAYFTACRGSLDDYEGGEQITDPELLSAVDMYVEARDLEKQAAAAKREATRILTGTSGTTGQWQVRWVDVQPTVVDSFEKAGYSRCDIRKVRGRQ